MAGNYAQLLDIINNPTDHSLPAWDNNNKLIEGLTVKQYLLTIVSSLTVGYQFMGVASENTSGETPDQNVFYLAGAGIYNGFGSNPITIDAGYIGIIRWNGAWSSDTIKIADIISVSQNIVTNANKAVSINIDGNQYNITDADAQEKTNVPIVVDFNNYTPQNGWIISDGTHSSQSGSLYYAIPLNDAKSITITAKSDLVAVIVFAQSISENNWVKSDGQERILIEQGTTQNINCPTDANYLIVGARSSDQTSEDYYLPQLLSLNENINDYAIELNNKVDSNAIELNNKIDSRTLNEINIDYADYAPLLGWVSANGYSDQPGSIHYAIPLNGAKEVLIKSKTERVAVITFASQSNPNSGYFDYIGTVRYIVEADTEQTFDVPNGANYLIVGARSSDQTSEDYYLPQITELLINVIDFAQALKETTEQEIKLLNDAVSKERMAGAIRFCTYNIGRFSHGMQHDSTVTQSNYAQELSLYQNVLKAIDADIIFLDEYNDLFCASYDGQPKYAKDVLFAEFPVRHIENDISASSLYNVSFFSYRFLKNIQKGYLSVDNQRYYIMADYEINGVTIKVVNMHFGFTAYDDDVTTLQYLNQMIALLADYDFVILSGDMNMLADKTHFAALTTAGYTIANCGTFGDFETYNGTDERVTNRCIDQIATKGFRMSNVRMVEIAGASDHNPLVCDLIMSNY